MHDYPILSPYSDDILEEGMIITIEPGIYIPNKYGVRLEQEVMVLKNGYKVINTSKINLYL